MAPSPPLSLEAAQQLLRQFICLDRRPVEADQGTIQQAVRLVADHSDFQILGICADDAAQAEQALFAYLAALGYEERPPIDPATPLGPIYLKYNPKTGRCHSDGYVGSHRGVLLSCQSAYDGDVNETFGHLPLDLFD